MKTFEWKSDHVYAGGGKRTGKPPDTKGWLHVQDDGSLSVSPDDDYYHGEIDVHTARRIAEEIWRPMTDARQAGYDAYVTNPADTRDAKERDLYPDDQDMRIEWGAGWLQAQIEDELGIDVKAYAPVGGAGLGAIQEAVRKLRNMEMNEEAKQRRLKNFHMNFVPVVTIGGAESELKVHVGSEPSDRARMSDLAAFLSELDAEELAELGKLGAFRGYNGKQYDDPELDATDGAHPAWWRGCDHGVERTCEKMQRVATGDFTGKPAFASEGMNKLASDILALRGLAEIRNSMLEGLYEAILDLRASTVLPEEKPSALPVEVWEDLKVILERLKSG